MFKTPRKKEKKLTRGKPFRSPEMPRSLPCSATVKTPWRRWHMQHSRSFFHRIILVLEIGGLGILWGPQTKARTRPEKVVYIANWVIIEATYRSHLLRSNLKNPPLILGGGWTPPTWKMDPQLGSPPHHGHGRGPTTPGLGDLLTNHGYELLTKLDDPPRMPPFLLEMGVGLKRDDSPTF